MNDSCKDQTGGKFEEGNVFTLDYIVDLLLAYHGTTKNTEDSNENI